MGVYYSAYIGYGLLIKQDDYEGDFGEFEESLNDEGVLPEGYVYVTGGNLMASVDQCLLIGPDSLVHKVFNSLFDEFGATKVEAEPGGITAGEVYATLANLAYRLRVEPNIGFFGISSVG